MSQVAGDEPRTGLEVTAAFPVAVTNLPRLVEQLLAFPLVQRVQLGGNPGYMVHYGLGAVITAEVRKRTIEAIGPMRVSIRDMARSLAG